MNTLDLLNECDLAYRSCMHTAGPHGRDGCSVRTVHGETVLVFRGTTIGGAIGWLDFLNDLRCDLVRRPEYPGWVHRGFADSIIDLWDWIAQYQFQPNLWICGHSKGGSLAILAGHLLRDLRPNVITFGAPKTGDGAFSAGYGAACTRFESQYDVVPLFPPFGYDTVGTTINAPASWAPPPEHDVIDRHRLESGYRPWIAEPKAVAAVMRDAA